MWNNSINFIDFNFLLFLRIHWTIKFIFPVIYQSNLLKGGSKGYQHLKETFLIEGLTPQNLSLSSNVMVPCETSIIAKQDEIIFLT